MEHFDFEYFKYSKKTNAKLIRERKRVANSRDILVKLKASELAYDYYDGKRIYGYGGFRYDGRWKKFLPYIIKKYKLNKNSKVLDIGCKKGFFIKDLKDLVPGIKVFGVEDHRYPIDKSLPSVRKNIKFVDRYYELNFKRNYFDFVIAHNSIYKYNLIDLMKTLRAIQKIGKKSHITIPIYQNEKERVLFNKFTLLATVVLSKKDWLKFFKYVGYKGDYYFSGAKSLGLTK